MLENPTPTHDDSYMDILSLTRLYSKSEVGTLREIYDEGVQNAAEMQVPKTAFQLVATRIKVRETLIKLGVPVNSAYGVNEDYARSVFTST